MPALAQRRATSDTRAVLLAGALSGLMGLLVFLVAHYVWTMPIWTVATCFAAQLLLPAAVVVSPVVLVETHARLPRRC